jgi:hypothetical protein
MRLFMHKKSRGLYGARGSLVTFCSERPSSGPRAYYYDYDANYYGHYGMSHNLTILNSLIMTQSEDTSI